MYDPFRPYRIRPAATSGSTASETDRSDIAPVVKKPGTGVGVRCFFASLAANPVIPMDAGRRYI
ncbi:hypothetical protein B2D07_08995 [Desulfococcus multivorans]|nr:hypothetical protein B2D07_08995 [Desulfococcus multivorans]